MQPWQEHLLAIALPVLGSVLVAWITSRHETRKSAHDIESRVAHLEECEPAEVDKLRTEAHNAADLATSTRAMVEAHITESTRVRRAADERDVELARRLEKIADALQEQGLKIAEQGAYVEQLRTGSRRGR